MLSLQLSAQRPQAPAQHCVTGRAERRSRARHKNRNVTVLPRMAGAPAQQEIDEPTSK
jgi:hypothetical protein